MPPPTFGAKLKLAVKAAVGVFSERAATEAFGLLAGLYPTAAGPLPERGTLELLDGYKTMPWLRAVAYRVAHAVATTPWVLYRPAGGKRQRAIQRTYRHRDRGILVKQAVAEERLIQIERHILLDALDTANSFMVGPSLMFITQVHLDLPGEAFWIKERNGLGAPVGFWPIPPHWVKSTPTVRHQFFDVAWSSWRGEIPSTEILWFTEPNPANPYGRGSGLGFALADELETDEYASKHTKSVFLNRARPDLIIWPEETKFDAGTIDESNARRLAEKWRAEHQGFWRAALPYFATRKLGVHELSQNFQELQLTELRKYERDCIIQVWGVPPEQLGIIENSNRSTIDTSDYLMKRNVVEPRLDMIRAYLQERLIPEYDERLIIDYVSPVQEDKEHQLKVAEKAPWSLTLDEWRALTGHEALPDGQGRVHMVPAGISPMVDPSMPPPSPFALTTPAPGPPTQRAQAVLAEWGDVLTACLDAGDADTTRIVRKALADDPDDLPELSRRVGRKSPSVRRQVAAALTSLRDQTSIEDIEALLTTPSASDQSVLVAVPVTAWAVAVEESARTWLAETFVLGAKVGGEQAGLQTREPHPVFQRVNPEAVAWAHRHAGTLIAQVGPATVAGVRASVATALELGWHPTKLARLIRETIGLTDRQSAAVVAFANRLAEADENLADETLFARVGRYAEAQRRVRAMMIARTELAEAASAGQQRLWDLAIQDGVLVKDRMRKRWLATLDELIEPRCEQLATEEVGVDEAFSNGRLGPPDHPQCRCAAGLVTAAAERTPPPPATVSLDTIVAKATRDALADFHMALAPPVINISIPEREVHVHVPPSALVDRVPERDESGRVVRVRSVPQGEQP